MYMDALEFLEEERDAWAPFEALAGLSDDELAAPVDEAHGWSGRDLMGHLIAWQQVALDTAKELAIGETSATRERIDREWETRGGDVINAELVASWAARPMDEVREAFRTLPGELRGYLTVVPETRWLKNARFQRVFHADMTGHYEEHAADLTAILDAGR